MKLYKVLQRVDGKLLSPYQYFEYAVGKKYDCGNDFNTDRKIACSTGYYATDVDGLIYSFRNLPDYEVWLCKVGGKSVELDPFKRRYQTFELIERIPNERVKELAAEWEPKVGYKLAEALYPIHPFKIPPPEITDVEVDLVKQWDAVGVPVRVSIRNSVGASVWDSVGASVWGSVWDSIGVYISSLFPVINNNGNNPFQPAVDLWRAGLVPSYDGHLWRLHAGSDAKIVWEEGGSGNDQSNLH